MNPIVLDHPDLRALSSRELVDHVVATHHAYLHHNLPWIAQMATKVARVHGEHNVRLAQLDVVVGELAELLDAHLDDEEEELFPSLLAGRWSADRRRAELQRMRADHADVGQKLALIRTCADDFTVPEWGCSTYRTLFVELQRLESDTLRHVHLENHLLAPRFADPPGA